MVHFIINQFARIVLCLGQNRQFHLQVFCSTGYHQAVEVHQCEVEAGKHEDGHSHHQHPPRKHSNVTTLVSKLTTRHKNVNFSKQTNVTILFTAYIIVVQIRNLHCHTNLVIAATRFYFIK